MLCKKCNATIADDSKFCNFCGSPIEHEPDTPPEVNDVEEDSQKDTTEKDLQTVSGTADSELVSPSAPEKQNKKLFILIAAIILVIACIAGYKIYSNSQLSKYEAVYDDFMETKDELIINDSNVVVRTESLADSLHTALEQKNKQDCKEYGDELLAIHMELLESSKEAVLAERELVNSADQSYLFAAERVMLEDDYKNAEKLLQEEKYKTAYSKFEECLNFINVTHEASIYQILLEQIDQSNYPNTKLYLKVTDFFTGETIDGFDLNSFRILEKVNNVYQEKQINKITLMDQTENLNIGIVADVSASMGAMLYTAEDAMSNLVSNMQFSVGDRAALYSFADTVQREQYFTNNAKSIRDAIYSLKHGNMTALYDALGFSLSEIIVQDGAKCIIAFTDGIENYSKLSKEFIIEKALHYKVPIYLIGVGNQVDAYELEDIATRTGGMYFNIKEIYDMSQVYSTIYKEQKTRYVLEYTTDSTMSPSETRELFIRYDHDGMLMRNEIEYIPEQYAIKGFIFHDSDKRYLTEAELDNLTEAEVRIALNEIYARRGYIFQTAEDMMSHFSNCDWYNGTEKDMKTVAQSFNKFEKKNVDLLVNYEIKNKLNGRVK